jgi:MFS family permease
MSEARLLARNLPVLYATRFLYQVHFLAAVLIPFFRDWGGLSLGEILLLNAWFFLWVSALEVPTGGVADRFGRKASVLLGYAFGALGVAIYVSVPRFPVFLLAELVVALGTALASGADEALIYDSLAATGRTSEAARVFAHAQSFRLAGLVVGPIGGSFLNQWLGLRATVACQVIPMALAAVVGLALREPPRTERGRSPVTWGEVLREGAGHVWASPALRVLALDMIAVNAISFLAIWLYQPVLEAAGVPVRWFGAVHVGLSSVQIVVLQVAGRLQSALGSRRRLLRLFPALAGAAYLGLALARSPVAVVPLLLCVFGFGLSRAPLLSADLNRHIPSERRATTLSAISMGSRLAITLGDSLAALGTRCSLHGTVAAAGLALLALAASSRVRDEHLG